MNRYFINGNILEAGSAEEAVQKTGATSTAIRPENGFAVKSWLWSAEDQDYTIEDLGKTGQKFFEKFADANGFFDRAAHDDLFGADQEGKIELVQYKYGLGRVVKSRILLPRVRH